MLNNTMTDTDVGQKVLLKLGKRSQVWKKKMVENKAATFRGQYSALLSHNVKVLDFRMFEGR